jgi:hypothetical protein
MKLISVAMTVLAALALMGCSVASDAQEDEVQAATYSYNNVPCKNTCDKDCIAASIQQGIDPDEITDLCCNAVCEQPPVPGCQTACDEACKTDLASQGASDEDILEQCCQSVCPPPAVNHCETAACNPLCVSVLEKQGIFDDGMIHLLCCLQTCTPPPPALGCHKECDPQCEQLFDPSQTDPSIVEGACCKMVCPPPPGCEHTCDPTCMNSDPGAQDPGALVDQCCKQDCTGPVPPPCQTQCDQQCMMVLGQYGFGPEVIQDKCCMELCQDQGPVSGCENTCDQACIAALTQYGIDPQTIKVKCCDMSCGALPPPPPPCADDCNEPPPPPCQVSCDQTCIAQAMQQGLGPDEIKSQCCQEDCTDPNLPPEGDPSTPPGKDPSTPPPPPQDGDPNQAPEPPNC